MTENVGVWTWASEKVGATEPALRLLVSLLAVYPLALLHRHFIYGKGANLQHTTFIIVSALIGYFNYGLSIANAYLATIVTYAILALTKNGGHAVIISFIFNMAYLLIGYHYASTDNYDINWTLPHCVLVLRLIAVAFDLYDGQRNESELSVENRKVALKNFPTILEFVGHATFPASFLIGPQFSMRRYLDYVDGRFGTIIDGKAQAPSSGAYAKRRFFLGLFYLAIYQTMALFVDDRMFQRTDFTDRCLWSRLILLGVWGRGTLYKYISCWLLSEGACALYGVSLNEQTNEWDGVANVRLSIFENTIEFNDYIKSFNINTNHWVAQYIFKRLKFLGNKNLSQAMALVFLAIWHGYHSGYYITFLFEFVVIYTERDVKNVIAKNSQLSAFFATPSIRILVNLLLRIYTFIFMGWCLIPFVLLTYDRYWTAFGAVNYCGFVLFLGWLLVVGPLIRLVLQRGRAIKKQE